jgi:hypothetical protein
MLSFTSRTGPVLGNSQVLQRAIPDRAQELQLRLDFRMLSTAFSITFELRRFKIARLRMRFDYVVRVIANANHSIMRAPVKPCVADCIALSRPRHQKRF